MADVQALAPVAGARPSGDRPSDGTGQDADDSPAPAAVAVTPGGTAPTQGAAPSSSAAAPAPPAPPVAGQLAQQVAVFRGAPDGTHSMTVVLRPDNLGPVQVQVTLDNGVVDLTLRGAHDHGRDALLQALPDLRRDLQSAGLTCSRLDVDQDTGGSWTAQQQSSQQQTGQQQAAQQQTGGSLRGQGAGEPTPRPWTRSVDVAERRAAVPSSASPGFDVLA
jgi:flagellar hook-length control protein FliK